MDAERLKKLKELEKKGIFPYHELSFDVTHHSKEILDNFAKLENKEVSLAGRIMSLRKHGKLSFAHIQDEQGKIQLYIKADELGKDYSLFEENFIDLGDIIGVKGTVTKTMRGEISVLVKSIKILTKALNSLPEKYHGLKDVELRYRQRYLDLIFNPEVKETFTRRSKIIAAARNFLLERGFMEVETPILQPIYGGAEARPFTTYHNELKMNLFLRIAPELYLKRLLVGGFEKVFEIGKNFRNEGIDTRHNPEFDEIEVYWTYHTGEDMMRLTEELAPLPVPTIIAVGVANPNAHGHAMTSTAIAFINENWKLWPSNSHNMNVANEIKITTGTNLLDTASANLCIGAFELCASSTIFIMRLNAVPSPTAVALKFKLPFLFIVPPMTLSPCFFSTGIDSPVIIDSSTEESPEITMPSTGIFSPGLTINMSPIMTSSIGTLSSLPFRITAAVFGERPISFFIASEVFPRAAASSHSPNRTNVINSADVSKYKSPFMKKAVATE